MGITRSGYYRWLRRRENKTARQETKETLKMLIKNYHSIHPEKGYRALRKISSMRQDGLYHFT